MNIFKALMLSTFFVLITSTAYAELPSKAELEKMAKEVEQQIFASKPMQQMQEIVAEISSKITLEQKQRLKEINENYLARVEKTADALADHFEPLGRGHFKLRPRADVRKAKFDRLNREEETTGSDEIIEVARIYEQAIKKSKYFSPRSKDEGATEGVIVYDGRDNKIKIDGTTFLIRADRMGLSVSGDYAPLSIKMTGISPRMRAKPGIILFPWSEKFKLLHLYGGRSARTLINKIGSFLTNESEETKYSKLKLESHTILEKLGYTYEEIYTQDRVYDMGDYQTAAKKTATKDGFEVSKAINFIANIDSRLDGQCSENLMEVNRRLESSEVAELKFLVLLANALNDIDKKCRPISAHQRDSFRFGQPEAIERVNPLHGALQSVGR